MKLTQIRLSALKDCENGNIVFANGAFYERGWWQKPNQQKFRFLRDSALITFETRGALGDSKPVFVTAKGLEVLNKHKEQ